METLKLTLEDRFGNFSNAWITNIAEPWLVDDRGNNILVVDRLYPYVGFNPEDPLFKHFLDAFMCRPSPSLFTNWLMLQGKLHDEYFDAFGVALWLLTGKILVKTEIVE